jgi:hypothetical protein
MRLKMTRVALRFMLAQLCLPAAALAGSTDFRLAGERGGPSICASSAHRMDRNSLEMIVGVSAVPFESEPSTGFLLVIGLGLIGGASLIGMKIGRDGTVNEQENAGETAISPRSARSLYGQRMPTIHIAKR